MTCLERGQRSGSHKPMPTPRSYQLLGDNAMRYSISAQTLLEDVRFANKVLDEAGHLGLSEEYASRLREILHRRIEQLEAEVSRQTSASESTTNPALIA